MILVAEIILTLRDFVVEITVRRSLGDVYAGERITHAIMGILVRGDDRIPRSGNDQVAEDTNAARVHSAAPFRGISGGVLCSWPSALRCRESAISTARADSRTGHGRGIPTD